MISEGCSIAGKVDFSIIFNDVIVEEGAVIRDSILMPGTRVKKGAHVQYAILAENTIIEENATVGERPEDCKDLADWGVAVVAENIRVGKNASVPAKAMVEADVEGGE